jgi:hypothetical protein
MDRQLVGRAAIHLRRAAAHLCFMKSVFLSIIPALLAVASLSSCATKFTPEQRASLSSVAIAPTQLKERAYRQPDAGATARDMPRQMQGQVQGGAIGAMLLTGISEGIAAAQNASFHKKNGNAVATVNRKIQHDLHKQVDQQLARALKRDAFFGPRLNQRGTSSFHATVNSYGLIRTGDLVTSPAFAATVSISIELKNDAGKKLFTGNYDSRSELIRSIDAYANDPKLARQAYAEALQSAFEQFRLEMAKKTAP